MNPGDAPVDQLAIGLYIILTAVGVWYLQKWSAARFLMRSTSFELERNFAREQTGKFVASLVLVLEAGLFVFGVQTIVIPQMREDDAARAAAQGLIQQANADQSMPATPTFAVPDDNPQIVDPVDPSELGGAPVQDIVATPTNTPTLVGTIEPNVPAPIGCDTPNAFLQIPANGMRVFQQTPVVGTAFVDDFSSYKIEIRGPGIPDFAILDQGITPVREQGALSQFNPAPYDRGTFQFRLMVFDSTTELRASCQVTIYITDPPLTATPIPTLPPGAQIPVAVSPTLGADEGS